MAKRLKGRYGYAEKDPFKVTFHPERLNEPSKLKKPAKIFTCSMGDIFDEKSTYTWVEMVFKEIRRCPQHTFQILTQCSDVINQFLIPTKNVWLGVTVKTNREAIRIKDLIRYYNYGDEAVPLKFVSFEPLLEDVYADLHGLDWIIIGGKTGTKEKSFKDSWVNRLVYEALTLEIPIFMKPNLWKLGYKGVNKYQQFPKRG